VGLNIKILLSPLLLDADASASGRGASSSVDKHTGSGRGASSSVDENPGLVLPKRKEQ
jgi:hypothetical protein